MLADVKRIVEEGHLGVRTYQTFVETCPPGLLRRGGRRPAARRLDSQHRRPHFTGMIDEPDTPALGQPRYARRVADGMRQDVRDGGLRVSGDERVDAETGVGYRCPRARQAVPSA